MTAATGTAPAEVTAWMDAAVAGDRDAYGRLYARYHPFVLRFVRVRVGNPRLAEDLTADVFTRALARIGTFVWQGRDPGAWFLTIARNLVADHFKSGRYRHEVVSEDVSEHGGTHLADFDAAVNPELATIRYLDAVEALVAVKSLTPDQRQVLVLRFLYGLNVAETARAMGKQEGATKALQYRAVRAAAVALRTAAGPAPERPIAARVIPRPRRPMDEPPPPRAPEPEVPDPGDLRLMWRCRDCGRVYAQPYRTHGAPVPCGGWLEPIVGPPCPR